jgi:hypothetical protein
MARKKRFDKLKVGECFKWRAGGQRAKKRGALTFSYEDDTTKRRRARAPMRRRVVRVVSCPANLKGRAR